MSQRCHNLSVPYTMPLPVERDLFKRVPSMIKLIVQRVTGSHKFLRHRDVCTTIVSISSVRFLGSFLLAKIFNVVEKTRMYLKTCFRYRIGRPTSPSSGQATTNSLLHPKAPACHSGAALDRAAESGGGQLIAKACGYGQD